MFIKQTNIVQLLNGNTVYCVNITWADFKLIGVIANALLDQTKLDVCECER